MATGSSAAYLSIEQLRLLFIFTKKQSAVYLLAILVKNDNEIPLAILICKMPLKNGGILKTVIIVNTVNKRIARPDQPGDSLLFLYHQFEILRSAAVRRFKQVHTICQIK